MPNLTKPRKKKRTYKTVSEKRHMDAVAELGCVACETWRHSARDRMVHHCFTGMGRRKVHFKTISLCYDHHQRGGGSAWAFHVHPEKFKENYGTEEELLFRTYAKLNTIGKLEPGARKIWEEMKK